MKFLQEYFPLLFIPKIEDGYKLAMEFNLKIKPYVKIPRSMESFLGRYLLYDKNRKANQHKYKNLEDRIINYLLIATGEAVKFIFTAFAFVIVKLRVNFGIKIKGTEKYFD